MPHFDLPLDELREYRPEIREPADFDEFWARTLAEARTFPMEPLRVAADSGLSEVEAFDVTFPGFGGHPIKAWLLLPTSASRPLPAIVTYIGYSGGRGFAHQWLPWAVAGYAVFVMDTRGQGTNLGLSGATADPDGSGPSASGFMTRGIDDPANYFYRRVFTDGVRAVDAVRSFPEVDASRVAVTGGSQGGGIALAVAALVPEVRAAMPDVPFLSHFARAVSIGGKDPFAEITRYLASHRDQVDRVFTTLSYFDGANFAARATCPALFSVGLMDEIVPPSTVFASFNRYAGDAEIEVYPYNDHEGGAGYQWIRQRRWVEPLLAAGREA
jgi:cephalosporin-C deacetylase